MWLLSGKLLEPVLYHTATLLPNGMVLVAGGQTSTVVSANVAQLYTPSNGQWQLTSSMNVARAQHTATLLQDGMVLAVGGFAKAQTELYDPSTRLWSLTTGKLIELVTDHTATLLPNGNVIVMGGANGNATVAYLTQVFNWNNGLWSQGGNLTVARFVHTATLLNNGLILVVGGEDFSSYGISTVELFNSNTGLVVSSQDVQLTKRYLHTTTPIKNVATALDQICW